MTWEIHGPREMQQCRMAGGTLVAVQVVVSVGWWEGERVEATGIPETFAGITLVLTF